MKTKVLILFSVILFASSAFGQSWQVPLNTIPYGKGPGQNSFGSITNNGSGALCLLNTLPPSFGPCSGSLPVLNSGRIFVGNASNLPVAVALSGDCTLVAAGAITCTKTNGSAFAALATSTDAVNLTGTVASARISGSYTGITAVGTIATGVWQGTVVDTTRGGFGTSVAAATGVPIFTAGVPTFQATMGTGNVARASGSTLSGTTLTGATEATGSVRFSGLSGVGTPGCIGNDASGNLTAGNGCSASGVPNAGVLGQVLVKYDATNGHLDWFTPEAFNISSNPSVDCTGASPSVLSTLIGSRSNAFVPDGCTIKVGTNDTIAAGKTFTVACGGSISVASGVTLVINAVFKDPGQCQVFQATGANSGAAGTGSVTGIDQFVRPDWWGCDYTGSVDCTTSAQQAVNAVQNAKGGKLQFSCGLVKINGLTISVGIEVTSACPWQDFIGTQGTNSPPLRGSNGTYILTTDSTKSAILISDTGTGCYIHDLAFQQTQPADAGGWAPTVYPATIYHQGSVTTSGSCKLEKLLFRGVYIGIKVGDGSLSEFVGRDFITQIYGTFFETGIAIDAASDVIHVHDLHAWPIYFADSSTPNIYSYLQAHTQGLVLGRVDDPTFDNIFINSALTGVRFVGSAVGITSGAQFNGIILDGVKNGFLVESAQNDFMVSNFQHQCPGAGPYTSGCYAVQTSANGNEMQFVNSRLINYQDYSVTINGSFNYITFSQTRVKNCNFTNTGTFPMTVAAANVLTLTGAFFSDGGTCPTVAPFANGAGTINESHVN